MTKVVINPGICGFTATIEVSQAFKRRVSINITSDCEQVANLGESLTEVDSWDVLKARGDSEVDMQASKHKLHPTCPVPTGILKAIEVEAGLALARDAVIHFETSEYK